MRHISTGIGVMAIVLAISSAYAQDCGGETCLSSEFCQLPEGVCDPEQMPEQGVCVEPPLYCYDPYDAVCGCDGITYENECTATQWHRSIDFQGECPAPELCGGFSGNVCYDPEEYCYFDDNWCCCDLIGHCLDIPVECPVECSPVCGCDGESYLSFCELQMAPTNLKHEGDCDEILWFRFASQDELTWRNTARVTFYNLYREIVTEWPPLDSGDCLQEDIPDNGTFVIDDPPGAGELWLFLVTGQFPEGEGGMGRITTDCSLRVPKAACGG